MVLLLDRLSFPCCANSFLMSPGMLRFLFPHCVAFLLRWRSLPVCHTTPLQMVILDLNVCNISHFLTHKFSSDVQLYHTSSTAAILHVCTHIPYCCHPACMYTHPLLLPSCMYVHTSVEHAWDQIGDPEKPVYKDSSLCL